MSPHPERRPCLVAPNQHLASATFFSRIATAQLHRIATPALLIGEEALEHNALLLHAVRNQAPCRMLLALKAFANWPFFPLLRPYFDGVCASGLHEARLGAEEFGGEVHSYSPAYAAGELEALLPLSHHIVFNSVSQWLQAKALCQRHAVSPGLRINLDCSVVSVPLYDPSAPGSRLGTLPSALNSATMEGVEGLHFHNLCEQGLEPLQRSLAAFEQSCQTWFPQLRWVNFGGGHHISRSDYPRGELVELIRSFHQRHGVDVILEPGEAAVLNSGLLLTRVLDIVDSSPPCAVLDTSITCHMPDVMEMPYRPEVWGAAEPRVFPHRYQLGGRSCLAGDQAGVYSFPKPLSIGQLLIFDDMAHYTSVKATTFNGVPLPSLWLYRNRDARFQLVKNFDYHHFKGRLG